MGCHKGFRSGVWGVGCSIEGSLACWAVFTFVPCAPAELPIRGEVSGPF